MPPLTIHRAGALEVVTLNRPERLNALNEPLAQAMLGYFESRRRMRDVRVVILTGAGRGFCSGADLKAMRQPDEEPLLGIADGDWQLRDLIKAMRSCPQPIIALVNGPAAGGGLAFALASDIVVAGENATFSTAFIKVALSGAELGVGWLLQRAIGQPLARDMILTNRKLDAREALAAGLVSRVVADSTLVAEGQAIAETLLRAAPDALRLTKRSLDAALEIGGFDAALELEERAQLLCIARRGGI